MTVEGEVIEEQTPASDEVDTQAAEQAAADADAARVASEKEASEKIKGRDSDDKGDPTQAKSAGDYKKLQGEYTRTTQELADLRRQAAAWDAEKEKIGDIARKAQVLENLAANPKFKAWAETELLAKQYGTENWEELTPQQQIQYLTALTERKAEEAADRKLAILRQEYEPARARAAEADANSAVSTVAEKYGEIWTDNLDAFKQLIGLYDQAALSNPSIKQMMDHPTEELVETIFLRAIGPRIKDIGKKAYQSELEKKSKAKVADGQAGSAIAEIGPAKTIEQALAAAKRTLNITKLEMGE